MYGLVHDAQLLQHRTLLKQGRGAIVSWTGTSLDDSGSAGKVRAHY
jgi:hypothetical protein